MSYFVEAYLDYHEYLNGEKTITFIFIDREEYERLYLEICFFSNLYVVRKGYVDNIEVTIEEEYSSENESD